MHLFESNMITEVSGNETLLHLVRETIAESQNPFEDFDIVFNNYFKTGQTVKDLLFMSIYERIFLRVLRQGEVLPEKSPRIFNLGESAITQMAAHIGMPGAGAVFRQDRRNKDDIPCALDLTVKCTNEHFQNFTEMIFTTFNTKMQPLSTQILVGYLLGKVEQMFRITKEDPTFIVGRRNIAYSYLTFVKQSLTTEFLKFQNQRIQIHELVGNSGVGKSLAVFNLSMIIHALVPKIPMEDLVYTRANDYWWNGYCGQPIVLYDDFTHVKTKMKFDFVFELIAVASGTFRNPPMAFDKNMKFTSLLGVVTSNIPVITTTRCEETISALKRRVISQRWTPKRGVLDEQGSLAFKGILLNSIESERSVFSLFSETQIMINSTATFAFEHLAASELIYDDEISSDSEESTISMLTSSVPESYSAMIDMDDQTQVVSELVSAESVQTLPSSGKPIEGGLIVRPGLSRFLRSPNDRWSPPGLRPRQKQS
jgi:hypothetical protein